MEDARLALVSRIADDIWNRGDLDATAEVMAADAVYHGPHMPDGVGTRRDWREHIARVRAAFPDSHVTLEALVPCGDLVVGRWSATGTHTGAFGDRPPTGRGISIGGITIYRLSGGVIVEAWEQLDLLGMWRQLGAAEPAGGRPAGKRD